MSLLLGLKVPPHIGREIVGRSDIEVTMTIYARDHDCAEALTHDGTSAPRAGRQLHGRHAGPWDIGRPQPAFVRLADEGRLTGRLLDAGCGTGENALLAASRDADTFEIHPMGGTTQVQAWLAAIRRN